MLLVIVVSTNATESKVITRVYSICLLIQYNQSYFSFFVTDNNDENILPTFVVFSRALSTHSHVNDQPYTTAADKR